jgi:hypothetical protein
MADSVPESLPVWAITGASPTPRRRAKKREYGVEGEKIMVVFKVRFPGRRC